VATETGARRIAQVAVRQAQVRQRAGRPGKVSIVTKQNVLRRTDGIFKDVAEAVLREAGLPFDHYYVDDACRRLVAQPEAFDVILTPTLFGDIMSDIAAELVGGLGVAPSACVGDGTAYFESVHGSAPDIAGRGIANPLATILSAEMMLAHLGHDQEARRLGGAVDRLLAERRVLPPDLGGSARTDEVAGAVIALAS
jgi:isocitrate/isopropylmalate dehydrogenase